MSDQSLATTGSTELGPVMSQAELDDIFGCAGNVRAKLTFMKLDKDSHKFIVPGPDGNPLEYDTLDDVVIAHIQQGRVCWDPDAPEASGEYLCKSADGVNPAPGPGHDEPISRSCVGCPMAKWGPKPTNPKDKKQLEAWKPKCDLSKAVLLQLKEGEETFYAILRISGTALGFFDDFISKSFMHRVPRRHYSTRFVEVWAEQTSNDRGLTWFVPKFALRGQTPAELQVEIAEAIKVYRVVMAANFDEADLEASEAAETMEPAGQTIEVDATEAARASATPPTPAPGTAPAPASATPPAPAATAPAPATAAEPTAPVATPAPQPAATPAAPAAATTAQPAAPAPTRQRRASF